MNSRPPFREIRELAEERAATLEFDGGMSRVQAESAVIAWAKAEFGVTLRIVERAEEELPLSRLTGRVFWPVATFEGKELTNEEKLDALSIAALRIANKHAAKLPGALFDKFEEAVLRQLAKNADVEIA